MDYAVCCLLYLTEAGIHFIIPPREGMKGERGYERQLRRVAIHRKPVQAEPLSNKKQGLPMTTPLTQNSKV